MEKIKCLICKTETSNKKYCSRKCKSKGKVNKALTAKRVSIKCNSCDDIIICTEYEYKSGKKYCSRKCQTEGKKGPKAKQISVKCGLCDNMIACTENAYKNGKKYCSVECQHESYRKEKVERIIIICPICLKEFGVRGKIIERGNGRFCSRKCKDEYQKQTYIGSGNPMYGKETSEKQKFITSKRAKKLWEDEEFRCHIKNKAEEYYKINGFFYGMDDGSKRKRKNTNIDRYGFDNVWKNKEIRQKCEDTTFKLYGEYSLDLARKALHKGETRIEKITEELLIKNNIEFKKQYRLYINEKEYRTFDFYIIKSNILIEVDGDFWHANPLIYDLKKLHIIQEVNLKNDKLKNELAQKFDIKLIRFWETDIKKENFELILIDKILNT